MIVLACAAAVLAGTELVARRQLVPLGWWLVATAPAEASTLLVANWREHVSRSYGNGLITATALLLSGLVVATLRLVVHEESGLAWAGFAAVVVSTVTLDILALVVTWSHSPPEEASRALLSLVFLTLLLYAATPVAQRLSDHGV